MFYQRKWIRLHQHVHDEQWRQYNPQNGRLWHSNVCFCLFFRGNFDSRKYRPYQKARQSCEACPDHCSDDGKLCSKSQMIQYSIETSLKQINCNHNHVQHKLAATFMVCKNAVSNSLHRMVEHCTSITAGSRSPHSKQCKRRFRVESCHVSTI